MPCDTKIITLIPVLNEEDIDDMMFKYDRVSRILPTPPMLRVFLFPVPTPSAEDLTTPPPWRPQKKVNFSNPSFRNYLIALVSYKKKKIIHEHKNKNLSVSMHLKLSSNLFATPSLILVTKIILWFKKKKKTKNYITCI